MFTNGSNKPSDFSRPRFSWDPLTGESDLLIVAVDVADDDVHHFPQRGLTGGVETGLLRHHLHQDLRDQLQGDREKRRAVYDGMSVR